MIFRFFSKQNAIWRGIRIIGLAAILCAGCRREQIAVYDIPKESDAPPSVAASDASQLPIKFQTPSDWQQKPPGEMSLATFSMAGGKAELSVMSFPGEGASQLDLVNVVRENAGMAGLSAEQEAKLQEPVDIGGNKGSLVDLSGGTGASASGNRIWVAILAHQGVTWFFKMAGTAEAVVAQKPALVAFLKSVSFSEAAAAAPAPEMNPQNPHGQDFASANSGTMPAMPADALPAPPAESRPQWQTPGNWQEVPPTQMLLAKYAVTNPTGQADVTVSALPGSVGGLLMNVNRWRGQVGLAPVTSDNLDSAYTSLDVPDGKAMVVDVNGKSSKSGKDTRLIAIYWPRNGETWFYKLMGDSAAVGVEKDAFLKFVQSVRYPNG